MKGGALILAVSAFGWLALAQRPEAAGTAIVQGLLRDAQSHPVPGAVLLIAEGRAEPSTAHADAAGGYRFPALSPGTYTLRAEMAGYVTASFGPFVLGANETKQVDLTLAALAGLPEFSDEPKFIVAGVTDANNRGGHGSDTVVRSSEALAKAAAALSNQAGANATEQSLIEEAAISEPGSAALHHALAGFAEKRGNALEAVREYQRAAELDASEANLFDWGTELLTHRAAEQAIEVFAKGNRLFPDSVRMMLGLGAAFYARGSYSEAARWFFAAADQHPADPNPYLFLGKVQSAEITQSDGFVERLARFARLQPANALANYYYAAALWKRWKGPQDQQIAAQVQSLLAKAVKLDPALGEAYLQLGIVYSSLMAFPHAIVAYGKAIAGGAQPEAHYRLAQAYQRTGERLKARAELDTYEQLLEASAAETERERNAVQQFVFGLRDQ